MKFNYKKIINCILLVVTLIGLLLLVAIHIVDRTNAVYLQGQVTKIVYFYILFSLTSGMVLAYLKHKANFKPFL